MEQDSNVGSYSDDNKLVKVLVKVRRSGTYTELYKTATGSFREFYISHWTRRDEFINVRKCTLFHLLGLVYMISLNRDDMGGGFMSD